jgi:hypothetical protein
MDQLVQIIIVALLIIFLVFTYVFKRPSGSPKVNAAMGILSDVSDNIKIMEGRIANPQLKTKFELANWRRFKNKVGFLDDEVITSLDEAFALAGDFNSGTNSARGNQVLAAVQDTQLDKLREPLNKSKAGLSDWLRANYQTEMQNSKKRGIFG